MTKWSKYLFPEMVNHIPGTENKIYLTFDDGPTPGITSQVLALLSGVGAKATFFCKGMNVEAHPQVVEQILSDGHNIGNHGYRHYNGWETSTPKYVADCYKAAEFIPSKNFRPPYGKITPAQYKALKNDFTIYLWSALSWDFHPWVSPGRCLEISSKAMHPGAILVFHDTEKASRNLLYTLPKLLELALNKGYQFDVLPASTKSGRMGSAEHGCF